ncbi:MAG: hypothetical protein KF740_14740 [Ramlibacter sp.]|nr:hypothetical protein [Ramlibacter sp.]
MRLDDGGWLTEIDQRAMRREALALKSYIEAAPAQEERLFQYKEKVLPLVDAALSGSLQIPFKGQGGYSWRLMLEGLEPMLVQRFRELHSRFMNRIDGSAMWSAPSFLQTGNSEDYKPDIVMKDGVRYEWVEFED